jgi:hypothetical protein
MDEVTQLKLRIMALESQQVKTRNLLLDLCNCLLKAENSLDDKLKESCKDYLNIFTK